MWRRRNHYVNAAMNGVVTLLNASGDALVSMYDTGISLGRQAQKTVLHASNSKLDHTIYQSRLKVIALKCEIVKETVRQKWFCLLRNLSK